MVGISTGSDVVDKLLNGGFECDVITTIYGPAGSGKTNIALITAITVANSGKKVIYVDTEGGFSVERLKQLSKDYKKALENILFLQPTNFEEQKRAFEKLKDIVNGKIGLIIVDSISMLYRLKKNVDESVSESNNELAQQIGFLTELTRKNNIPVILTSQIYSNFDDGRQSIVGGDILKYGSKCLIELQNYHNNKRKIILKKHRSIAGEKETYFEIVDDGIKEC